MSKLAVVTSITGRQGLAIAQSFQKAGYRVRGLSRKAASTPGVECVTVDPNSVDAMTAALQGADVAVFTSPVDYREGVRERLAEALVAAASRAGVRRIILNTAAPVFEDYERPVSQSLRAVRDIVLGGAVEAVAIQPTVYMDNLIEPWAAPPIVNDGVLAYPAPADAPVSWISHASLGSFAVAAAQTPLGDQRIFNIGAAEAITGPEAAAIISATIGREVRYVTVEAGAFGAAMNAAFGPPVGDHLADFYRYLGDHKHALSRDSAGYAPLGVQPESFAAWAARQAWPQPA